MISSFSKIPSTNELFSPSKTHTSSKIESELATLIAFEFDFFVIALFSTFIIAIS